MKKLFFLKPIKIFLIFLVFTLIYIMTFHLGTRKLIPVYTYYGIFSLLLLTFLLSIILLIFNKKQILDFDIKDCIITVLICFSFNIFIFCMVPVTLERSISVFMLNHMNDSNGNTKEEIEEVFINKYVYEYEAFDKRFNEQIYTGTIVHNNNEYFISQKGKKLINIFKFIKRIYNVDSKILK